MTLHALEVDRSGLLEPPISLPHFLLAQHLLPVPLTRLHWSGAVRSDWVTKGHGANDHWVARSEREGVNQGVAS